MFVTLSLLAGLILTLVNFADKTIVSKYVKDWRVAVIFGAVAGGILALIVLPFNTPSLSANDMFLAVGVGVILFVGYFIYWKAISISSASLIVMLFQMSPIFTLVFSFYLLGEKLTGAQLFGFGLILLSTTALSIKKNLQSSKLEISEAFFLAFVSSIFFGIAGVIAKYIVSETGFFSATVLESAGVFIGGAITLLLSKSMRESFVSIFKTNWGLPILFIFGVELLYLSFRFISYAATFLGPVSIERVLENARIFFALIIGLILSKLIPSIFVSEKENFTPLKIIFAIILFFGVYLIS